MKRLTLLGLFALAATAALGAPPSGFTQTLRPEDFAAAGLAKLTAEERVKLDALVDAFQRDTPPRTHAPAAPVPRPQVVVAPGTEIKYETVESRIAGDFTGWEGRAVFKLENGQRWQLANPGTYYTPAIKNPAVKIAPAATGGFWMTVDGVKPRVRVVPVRE